MDKPSLPDTDDEAEFWIGFAKILEQEAREEEEAKREENRKFWARYDEMQPDEPEPYYE